MKKSFSKKILAVLSIVLCGFGVVGLLANLSGVSFSGTGSEKDSSVEDPNVSSLPGSSSEILDSSSSEDSSGSDDAEVVYPVYVGDGEIYHDEYVEINPTQANVQVGDTFKIEVEVTGGGTVTFKELSTSTGDFINVDENGNVTALSVGTGYVSVVTSYGSYLVEVNVAEATGETNDTYALSLRSKRGSRIITISHYIVKMHVGDSFTFEFTSTTTDTPTVTVEPIAGSAPFVSIDGYTITALKAGEDITLYLDFVEDDVPYLVYLTIVE